MRRAALLWILACRPEAPPDDPATAVPAVSPSPGVVAEAQVDAPIVPIGFFVLLRGGTQVHATAEPSSPSVLLSEEREGWVSPVVAQVLAVEGDFLEVQTTGAQSRRHCGMPNHWTSNFELHGWVSTDALAEVTTRPWHVELYGDVVDLPPGIAVMKTAAGTVIEANHDRLRIDVDPAVIGLGYPTPPDPDPDCFAGAFERLAAAVGVVESAGTEATIGFGNVGFIGNGRAWARLEGPTPIYFESGEPIGRVLDAIRVPNGFAPAPNDATRSCFDLDQESGGVAAGTRLCLAADAIVELPELPTPPRPPLPRVRQGKAKVKGKLDPDIIRRIVRAHLGEIRHCYNLGLGRNEKLAGRVVVAFTVGRQGQVGTATVASSTIADKKVGNCAAAAVKRWKFPRPVDKKTVKVTYPFELGGD